MLSPPYDIAIVTISYGRVTMSSVWDSMMSKKIWGGPSTPPYTIVTSCMFVQNKHRGGYVDMFQLDPEIWIGSLISLHKTSENVTRRQFPSFLAYEQINCISCTSIIIAYPAVLKLLLTILKSISTQILSMDGILDRQIERQYCGLIVMLIEK